MGVTQFCNLTELLFLSHSTTNHFLFSMSGYALSSAVGGVLVHWVGGPATFLVFGVLALVVCPLHWAFTSAFPAPPAEHKREYSYVSA